MSFHQYCKVKLRKAFPGPKNLVLQAVCLGMGMVSFSGMVGADALINGVAAGVTPYGRLANIGSVVFGQFLAILSIW